MYPQPSIIIFMNPYGCIGINICMNPQGGIGNSNGICRNLLGCIGIGIAKRESFQYYIWGTFGKLYKHYYFSYGRVIEYAYFYLIIIYLKCKLKYQNLTFVETNLQLTSF